MDFAGFVQEIEANRWPVYGVEVYADGRLAHAWGDTDRARHEIYSATKTITALAVGMAADDGCLALEDCVLRYLPGEVTAVMTPEQRAAYQPITLARLLSMSVAGYPFRPEGEHWLTSALTVPLVNTQERAFCYSNISAYLAGVAAACAVGEPLDAFLKRRLFEPLGIIDPPCGHCPDGYFYGASKVQLTVNELSRIGLTLYHGGVYAGRRIVSEAYVRAAMTVQQMNREGGYGFGLWKYRSGASINGKWGQKCFILPQEGRMVTYLANMETGSEAIRAGMEHHLLGT